MSDTNRQTSEELDRWLVELAYGEESSVPADARARIEGDPALSAQLRELKEARALASLPLDEPSAAMDDAIWAAADEFLAGVGTSVVPESPVNSSASAALPAAAPSAPIDLAAAREARRRLSTHPAEGAAKSIGEELAKPAPARSLMYYVRPLSLAASIGVVIGGSWLLLRNAETAMERGPAAAPAPQIAAAEADAVAAKRDAEEVLQEIARKSAEEAQQRAPARKQADRGNGEGLSGLGTVGGGSGGGGLGSGFGGAIGSGAGRGAAVTRGPDVVAKEAREAVAGDAPRSDTFADEAAPMKKLAATAAPDDAMEAEAIAPPSPAPTPAPAKAVTASPVLPVLKPAPAPMPSPTSNDLRVMVERKAETTASAPPAPPPAAATVTSADKDANVSQAGSKDAAVIQAKSLVASGRTHLLANRHTEALGAFRTARLSLETFADHAKLPTWQDAAAGEIDALLALGFDEEAERLAERLGRVAPSRVEMLRGVRRSRQYQFDDGAGNSAPAAEPSEPTRK